MYESLNGNYSGPTTLNNLNNSVPVEVVELVFTPGGNWKDQFTRPIIIDDSPTNVVNFENVIDRSQGADISAIDIINTAPNLITTSDQAEDLVTIKNGWNGVRYMFTLVVRHQTDTGYCTIYLEGYTDRIDTSISGYIAPDTQLIINSAIEVATTINPMNQARTNRITNNYNVHRESTEMGTMPIDNNGFHSQPHMLLRPADIVGGIINNNSAGETIPGYQFSTLQGVSGITDQAKTTDKMDTIGANTISKIYNAIKNTQSSVKNSTMHIGQDTVMTSALNDLAAVNHLNNPFFSKLSMVVKDSTPTMFNLKDLAEIDGRLSNPAWSSKVIKVFEDTSNAVITQSAMSNALTASDTAEMHSTFAETSIAVKLLEAVVSTMSSCFLVSVGFTYSNDVGYGMRHPFIPEIPPISKIPDIDAGHLGQQFENIFRSMIAPIITNQNQQGLTVSVYAIMGKNAKIEVQLAGLPSMVYNFPLCAISSYSSVVGKTHNLDCLVNNIQSLTELATA